MDLTKMTIRQIKAYAAEIGVEIPSIYRTKAQIIRVLETRRDMDEHRAAVRGF